MNPRYRRLLIPGLLLALVVVALVASLTGEASAADAPAVEQRRPPVEVVSTLIDPRIVESSGLAVSRGDDDLAYTINDSGSDPIVFAVRISTGETVGTTTVEGVIWRDPEALSIDVNGTLWVADTGDNLGVRDDAALYAFEEPGPGQHRVTPEIYPITYETGREDVEALLIEPRGGTSYVVTKGWFGGELLRLPDQLSTTQSNLAASTDITMPILVTDASFTPDGRYALVRTYLDAHVYDVEQGFERLWYDQLPAQPQGETLAVEPDGTSYLIGSEGVGSVLYRLPFEAPDAPTDEVPDLTEPTTDAGSAPVPEPVGSDDRSNPWPWVAAGAAGVVLGAVVLRRALR